MAVRTLNHAHYMGNLAACQAWWRGVLERAKVLGWDADVVWCVAPGRRVPQAGFVFRKPGPESASIDVEALMARFVAQRAQAMNEDWMDEQASHYGMSRDEWELSQWPDRD